MKQVVVPVRESLLHLTETWRREGAWNGQRGTLSASLGWVRMPACLLLTLSHLQRGFLTLPPTASMGFPHIPTGRSALAWKLEVLLMGKKGENPPESIPAPSFSGRDWHSGSAHEVG